MIVRELLADLRQRAIELWIEDGQLHYSAPKGALTSALRTEIGTHKAEIIATLGSDAPFSSSPQEFPLSSAQEEVWKTGQLGWNDSFPALIRLDGKLDNETLLQCLREIVRRHEVLQTVFKQSASGAVQVVAPRQPISLPVNDLGSVPAPYRKYKVLQVAAQQWAQPFDLTKGPLLRTILLKLDEQEHVLVCFVHHIVFDGWSIWTFVQELAALYQAFAQGAPSPLPEMHVQYADYVRWEQAWLQGEECSTQMAYWKRQLAVLPPPLVWPSDRAVTSPQGPAATGLCTFKLPVALMQKLRQFAGQEGVTLFMTLLAAFETLLYHYTGQEEMLVSTAVANRAQPEFEKLIGCFDNTLLLRTSLAGDLSFRTLLEQVREVTLEACSNQELPYDCVIEQALSEGVRGQARSRQITFGLQDSAPPTVEAAGLEIRQLEMIEIADEEPSHRINLTEDTNAGLFISLFDLPEGLGGVLKYSANLFEQGTIDWMIEHLKLILEDAIEDPTQPLSKRAASIPTVTTTR